MKTFQNFLSEKSEGYQISSLVRKLVESGINPVEYIKKTLFENMPVAPTAAPAPTTAAPQVMPNAVPSTDPKQDIAKLTADVTRLFNMYRLSNPNFSGVMAQINQQLNKLMQNPTGSNQTPMQGTQPQAQQQQAMQQAQTQTPIPHMNTQAPTTTR